MKIDIRTALLLLVAACFTASAVADDTRTGAADEPAAATDQAGTDATASTDDDKVIGVVKVTQTPDPLGMICRLEKPTGSHYPKRVCRSAAQVAKDRADAMTDIRATELRRRGNSGTRLGTGLSMKKYKSSRGGH